MAKGRVLTIQNLTAAQRDDLEAMQQAGGASVQVIPQGGNLFTIVATYPDTNDPGGAPPVVQPPVVQPPVVQPPVVQPPVVQPPVVQPPVVQPPGGPGGDIGSPVMNDAGFTLLKKWEGCILCAYDDANDQCVSSRRYSSRNSNDRIWAHRKGRCPRPDLDSGTGRGGTSPRYRRCRAANQAAYNPSAERQSIFGFCLLCIQYRCSRIRGKFGFAPRERGRPHRCAGSHQPLEQGSRQWSSRP